MNEVDALDPEFSILTTTTDQSELADKMANAAVENQMAACVQIDVIKSVYRWQNKIESAEEFRLTFKTRTALIPALSKLIESMHNYDLPEMLVVGIDSGSIEYQEWMRQQLG